MYCNILHIELSVGKMGFMEHEEAKDKRLQETVGLLTDENQRYFLGVLEALSFAQNAAGSATKTLPENDRQNTIRSLK